MIADVRIGLGPRRLPVEVPSVAVGDVVVGEPLLRRAVMAFEQPFRDRAKGIEQMGVIHRCCSIPRTPGAETGPAPAARAHAARSVPAVAWRPAGRPPCPAAEASGPFGATALAGPSPSGDGAGVAAAVASTVSAHRQHRSASESGLGWTWSRRGHEMVVPGVPSTTSLTPTSCALARASTMTTTASRSGWPPPAVCTSTRSPRWRAFHSKGIMAGHRWLGAEQAGVGGMSGHRPLGSFAAFEPDVVSSCRLGRCGGRSLRLGS